MGSHSKDIKIKNSNSAAAFNTKAEERSLLKEKIQFLQSKLNQILSRPQSIASDSDDDSRGESQSG